MASFRKAVAKEIKMEYPDLVKLVVEMDGEEFRAVAYPSLTGSIAAGDEVIVNTTAVDLGLGSGGFHIVLWNTANDAVNSDQPGHIMKMRYTPLQFNILAAEEKENSASEMLKGFVDLRGMPVVVGTLHSQLAPAAAVIKRATGGKARLAYIMTDRAALPLALSDSVRELKQKGLIDKTITVGQAFGGDIEAVNVFSGLAAAKEAAKADIAIVTMGIGVVGTETFLGFSGIEQGEIVNAVESLRGRPIAIPRIMFEDPRERHNGLSRQTVAALGVAALVTCDIPIPHMRPEHMEAVNETITESGLGDKHRITVVADDGTEEALMEYKLNPKTMGRGFDREPEFFRAAGAAGLMAARMLGGRYS